MQVLRYLQIIIEKMFLRIIVAIVLFVTIVECQNYCAANLCASGRRHIGCGNKGNFAAKCPKNARMVPRNTVKQSVVTFHNIKRNQIAGGLLPGYQPAVRMATMQWDDELAKLAEFNVKQCQMKHDQCRNTRTYSKAGQNLAILSFTGPNTKSAREMIRTRVNAWWSEYKNANMNIIRSYPKGYAGPAIGHFTAIVNEKNIRCGCGAIRYKEGKWNRFLLACNYATTNIIGQPLYRDGSAASQCSTGRNSLYPNLCSIKETYSGF